VAEGNYNINVELQQAGKNYVYKSDVMTLNEGAIGAEFTNSTTDATNITKASNPVSLWSTGEDDYTITVKSSASGDITTAVASLGAYLQDGSYGSITTGTGTLAAASSGYALVEITGDNATAAKTTFYDAKTGEVVFTHIDDNISDGITANYDSNADGTDDYNFIFTAGTVGSYNFQAGDKFLFAVTHGAAATDIDDGGGAITISGGPQNQSANITIVYSGEGSLTSKDADQDHTIYLADLDESTGNFNLGSVTLTFAKTASGVTDAGEGTLSIQGGGEAATSTTKLKDLARFTTADGRNLFDNTQELTIFGNGKSATIYLEGNDTISDFEQKLNDAIVNKLGMGTSSTSVNNNLVNYVAPGSAQDGTNEAVNGTFVIQSALLGENSQLSFIGDQALINGLSLATIQEGQESTVKVNVTDVHTGANVGSDLINDSKVKGIIDGVEVNLASNIGVDVSWDSTNKEVTFNPGEAVDIKLHLVDNSTDLQIGANEGQAINVSIAQIDTKSLGLEDVLMVDQSSAQKAITKLDKALEFVSSTRATIGAQINRLESAISNLNTARENLSASESRIRDLDMAEEMANFTRNQILSQAGTAMLAQANQLPQMALQLLQ
jgi:flagellin